MVRVLIRPNARNPDSVAAELLHQYNVKPAMLLRNAVLPLGVHLHDPVRGQVIRHLAHIVQVDKGITLRLAAGHGQAHKCVGSLNDAFQ